MSRHAGLAANELVDEICEEAASEAIELDERPTSTSNIKYRINKSTLKKWQRAWCLPDNELQKIS